jgi:hypothetical protein
MLSLIVQLVSKSSEEVLELLDQMQAPPSRHTPIGRMHIKHTPIGRMHIKHTPIGRMPSMDARLYQLLGSLHHREAHRASMTRACMDCTAKGWRGPCLQTVLDDIWKMEECKSEKLKKTKELR